MMEHTFVKKNEEMDSDISKSTATRSPRGTRLMFVHVNPLFSERRVKSSFMTSVETFKKDFMGVPVRVSWAEYICLSSDRPQQFESLKKTSTVILYKSLFKYTSTSFVF